MDAEKIFVSVGRLEVMSQDLGDMSWDDATRSCQSLGEGWRLPTRDELATLYENKDFIGGFTNDHYWSSTTYATNSAWVRIFWNGKEDSNYTGSGGHVRAVRTSSTADAPLPPSVEEPRLDAGTVADSSYFECKQCHNVGAHERVSDQYAGDLWICPSCGYKTIRQGGM
jgi:hypothetical protein